MQKNYLFFVYLFLLTVFLEVFVFNFRFWDSRGYKAVSLEITNVGEGLKDNGDGSWTFDGSENSYFEFKNINSPVKNLYVSILNGVADNAYLQRIQIDATDAGNKFYFELPLREVVSTVERSKYIKFNLAGSTEKLRINLVPETLYNIDMTENGVSETPYLIILDGVEINKPVPFFFEPVRFLFMYIIALILYLLRYNSECFKYELKFSSPNQRALVIVLVLANILLANFIYINNRYYYMMDRGVYTNLAESLLNGRFDLPMLKLDPALAGMKNPYDTNLRRALDVGYYWDYAFYKGKYYVYFGIVPCLILFLPLKALFNYNLPVNLAAFHFMVVLIVVSFVFIYKLMKRFFPKTSFVVYLLFTQMYILSTISPWLTRNDLYGIPSGVGLIFTMCGLLLWLGAVDGEGAVKEGVKSKVKLFFGSLMMALVAGCRPQLVMGSFFAILIFWTAVFKKRQLFSIKNRGVVNTALFVLPYIAVGAFLMYYNYARFGSVFDFGASYNLTTNDMTVRGFRLDRLPRGIYEFLFRVPDLCGTFPFLKSGEIFTKYMGVVIYENMPHGGVFMLNPFLWINFAAYEKSVKRYLKEKGLFAFALLSQVSAVIIIVVNVNMAGIVLRYCMEFVWLLMLGGGAIFLTVFEKLKGENQKRLRHAFVVTALVSVAFNMMITFIRYRHYTMDITNPHVFYSIMYAIQFWM